jgi:dihydrofolate reductase
MMKPISMIAAVAENMAIGKNNQLLWYIPEDLKRFKQITQGCTVIMGRKTWESLKIKPLPNRDNIILTNNLTPAPVGAYIANTVEEALNYCKSEKENFIIGGEMIYRVFLPIAQKLYITRIDTDFDADTYFPEIDPSWELVLEEKGISEKELPFTFTYLTYIRKY